VGQVALAPDALEGRTTARANKRRTDHFVIVFSLAKIFLEGYHA
jgi:hypothetical protein